MKKPSSARLPPLTRLALVAARAVLGAWVHFLAWSCKHETIGWEHVVRAFRSGRPVIIALWHSSISLALVARYNHRFPYLLTMISASRDGEIGAELAKAFRLIVVRASSSRRGAVGLLEFIRYLRQGEPGIGRLLGFHMLDGPRGPRHRSKPGIIKLAQRSGALVIPLAMGYAPRVVARSWDRHRIPLPFGRLAMVFGEPIDFGERRGGNEAAAEATVNGSEMTSADLDRIHAELASLHELTARDYAIE